MERTEPAVFTNLCMICDGDRVLVEERTDPGWPGITFPGGHVEPGEAFLDSVIREVREETGLTVSHLQLCGVKQCHSRDRAYRYVVFMYKTAHFSGELQASSEGRVFWMPRDQLRNAPLASGFGDCLDVFERDDLSEAYYWEEDGLWHEKNL